MKTLEAVRSVISHAISSLRGNAEKIFITLPGDAYEPFPLSTGSPVEWKQEPTTQGRKVRFKAHGPAQIGYHFHDVPEVLIASIGILFYDVGGCERALIPGDTYTAQPHEVHRAEFKAAGEALALWTDLKSDQLEISFFPQAT